MKSLRRLSHPISMRVASPLLIVPPSTFEALPVALPCTPSPNRVAVELSNFPPHFVKADILLLLKNFHVLEEFALPKVTRFAYPFRATIYFASPEEAERAVKDLHGTTVGGRTISVELKGDEEKQRAQEIQNIADQLRFAIVNTARTYFPHLENAILEIREIAKDNDNFAFLQARNVITLDGTSSEEHSLLAQNMAKWDFIAGGMAELQLNVDSLAYDVRLEALKDLSNDLEKQGVLRAAWRKWDGSHVLDQSVQEKEEELERPLTGFARMFAMGKGKNQTSRKR
ncbi:hypothetical protein P280DRAFT_215231 [Massarina eburnea CBS 473.64]|uniref:RRM domain-containing protein n=1 Tax=Massarina eburnea CBS 473.64 TaxID=1395130 RepID=A0A6A6SC30_9PLEO|nr:hypothetical protein P280DRAFT_215231 [Massarina eburnea CBS 473.64]